MLARIGKPLPEVYSADLSEFVFAAGVSILKSERPDLMYLSTTDYVQHKAAPGSEIANAFYAMMDRYVGELDAAGCVLVLTADHGMNDKHLANGEPDVIYLQDAARRMARRRARRASSCRSPTLTWSHHGALGSFATVYLPAGADRRRASSAGCGRSRASMSRSTRPRPARASSCRRTASATSW